MRRWSRPSSQSSATAAIGPAPRPGSGDSTRTRLKSQKVSMNVACTSVPAAHGSIRSQTASCLACRHAMARSRGVGSESRGVVGGWAPLGSAVVVLVFGPGAADHDLVLLDRDLDRPVAGPVLGVDGIVLHRGIEPQPVALLAVVEGALERAARRRALARAPGAAAAPARTRLVTVLLRGVRRLGGLRLGLAALLLLGAAGGLLGRARLLLGALRGLGLELRRDGGVVLRAEVDLLRGALGGAVVVGLELVLALER